MSTPCYNNYRNKRKGLIIMNKQQIAFIDEIIGITEDYDGDGSGMRGESYEGVVKVLQKDYPILFEIYKIL